jgi:outer membrane protein assembly factor BamB
VTAVGSRPIRTALVVIAAAVLSACGADWAQWGNGPARTSDQAAESTITAANVGTLRSEWGNGAGDLGESVTTPGVVASNLAQPDGRHTDVVYVGTQIGNLYAVRHDGSVLWVRNLGFAPTRSDCFFQPPGQVLGVRGSPVFDRGANRIYSTGGDGRLFALDAPTGAVVSGWPIRLVANPSDEYFGAPLFVGGFLYVPIGNPCGTGPGRERIVRVDVATRATVSWYVDGGGPNGESGGFGLPPGGPAADPQGNVYVGTGQTDFVDAPQARSIVKLSPSLQVLASWRPPSDGTYSDGNNAFGGPLLLDTPKCPNLLVTQHQDGSIMLFDRNAIASGPRQRIKVSTGFPSFGSGFSGINDFVGTPAWSARTGLLYVGVNGDTDGTTFRRGVAAFALDDSCRLVRTWNTVGPFEDEYGVPTVAGDVVYSVGGSGALYALDASTGRFALVIRDELSSSIGKVVVANGRAYLGDLGGNAGALHSFGVDNNV